MPARTDGARERTKWSHEELVLAGDDAYPARDSDSGFHSTPSPTEKSYGAGCPVVHGGQHARERTEQFRRIQAAYPLLSATGCSAAFCESGRMLRTNEPRVGQNRALSVVQREAIDFLCQLRRDHVIPCDDGLRARCDEVLRDIQKHAAVVDIKRSDVFPDAPDLTAAVGLAGGVWHQTPDELVHGIRLAWKHSRKCIMRSEYQSLRLCDLRHVTSSAEMGAAIIKHARKAFNGGDIVPTAFVFPPRAPGRAGPMVWNSQLLAFAGYTNDDGSVLGDPLNVELTRELIRFGWTPPAFRSRWDLLPLVTMADGDEPAITEIPEDAFPLVSITHPRFALAFEKLGLKWVPAPALSRLGFDIGGVQYTASPFLGWFMDAEIGVRDLADKQRYNVLPDIIQALGWVKSTQELEDAPEFEKLALLSRAQAELNYAVFYSFGQAGVRMSDTLTASSMYCSFDDEHLREHGFRLPADPYWLAPPQGSIVPLWHRGGAPNYQPKPLICRHVQDPVRAWKRRSALCPYAAHEASQAPASADDSDAETVPRRLIRIHYCSSGTTAPKLANRLHSWLSNKLDNSPSSSVFSVAAVEPLNSLRLHDIQEQDVLLLVASSCGRGSVPSNGQKLEKFLQQLRVPVRASFSIFGNGNSTYRDSFNGAARQLQTLFLQCGARPLGSGLLEGDTAIEEPPWDQFDSWLAALGEQLLQEHAERRTIAPAGARVLTAKFFDSFCRAKLVSCTANVAGIKRVVLDIGKSEYEILSHATVLVPNARARVKEALRTMGVGGNKRLEGGPTLEDFLTDFVDLERPFSNTAWADGINLEPEQVQVLTTAPMLQSMKMLPSGWRGAVDLVSLCSAMPLITPRTFSVASSQHLLKAAGKGHLLELLVKTHPRGLFSSRYLSGARAGSSLRLRFTGTRSEALLHHGSQPVVAMATGSGIAPIQSLLQHRVHQHAQLERGDVRTQRPGRVSVIVGFRPEDAGVISEAMQEALKAGLVDLLLLTPTNAAKARAQDKVFNEGVRDFITSKVKDEAAYVFVCASNEAAKDFSVNLSALLGVDAKEALGERYIEETFEPAT